MSEPIQRKWLLKKLPELQYDAVVKIEQYYKDFVRYRREIMDGVESFVMIRKERLAPGINREIWENCTNQDYFFNYPQDEKPIKKTRHTFEYQNYKLEIDVFESGLVMMEVEVENWNEYITIPKIVHELIEKEVTGNPDYSNHQLYRKANQLEPVKSKFPTKQVIRQIKRDYFVHRNKTK